jgi:hypothetical protein
MKQNKLVIVVLVVIAVLFVLGLSSGVFRNKDDKDDKLTMGKVQKLKESWLGSLDGAMDRFRSGFDNQRLDKWAVDGQTGERSYTLSDDKEHITTIAAKDGAGVKKAVLSVVNDSARISVKIKVPISKEDPCPEPTPRGVPTSFNKLKKSKAIIDIGKIKPGRVTTGTTQQPLELYVVYTPAIPDSEEAKSKRCEETGDLDLTVLDMGGELELKCKGCNPNRTVTVKLN